MEKLVEKLLNEKNNKECNRVLGICLASKITIQEAKIINKIEKWKKI